MEKHVDRYSHIGSHTWVGMSDHLEDFRGVAVKLVAWASSRGYIKNLCIAIAMYAVGEHIGWREGQKAAEKEYGPLVQSAQQMTADEVNAITQIHEQIVRNHSNGVAAAIPAIRSAAR